MQHCTRAGCTLHSVGCVKSVAHLEVSLSLSVNPSSIRASMNSKDIRELEKRLSTKIAFCSHNELKVSQS